MIWALSQQPSRRNCSTGEDAGYPQLDGKTPWTTDDLYRILLTGETDERGMDLTALETLFSGRFYALELRDRTRVRRDVWARADEDSLRGEFLRRLRGRYDAAADDKERENVTRAVRFGLAALDHRDIL